jgi:hypothetical protein
MTPLKAGKKYKAKAGLPVEIEDAIPGIRLVIDGSQEPLKVFQAVLRENEHSEVYLTYVEDGCPLVGEDSFKKYAIEGCEHEALPFYLPVSPEKTGHITFADLKTDDHFIVKRIGADCTEDSTLPTLVKDGDWAYVPNKYMVCVKIRPETPVIRLMRDK